MKPLILISDGGKLRKSGRLLTVLSQAFEGAKGAVESVILREQFITERGMTMSDAELLALARDVHELCERYKVKLILHSRKDLLLEADYFEGVHFNKASWNFSTPRAGVDREVLVGFSAHSEEECQHASQAGADYIFYSPIFEPNSKTGERQVVGLESLEQISRSIKTPVVALGGIDATRAAQCKRAGASAVAVIGFILCADDPAKSAAALVNTWQNGF